MKKLLKFFVILCGIFTGLAIAEFSYYPVKRAVKKRHYITLRQKEERDEE